MSTNSFSTLICTYIKGYNKTNYKPLPNPTQTINTRRRYQQTIKSNYPLMPFLVVHIASRTISLLYYPTLLVTLCITFNCLTVV